MPLLSAISRPHIKPVAARAHWYRPLFDAGGVGLVYDFTDLTMMFTDAGGTTPVATIGDSVASIRDSLLGSLAVLTSGTATLQYDNTLSLYYCAMSSTATYQATGIVPSPLLGNGLLTFISALVLTKPTNSTYCPCHIGSGSPSNGNAISLRQTLDSGIPKQVVEILQYGAGKGRVGDQQSGTGVLIGRKNSGTGSGTAMDLWWQGTQVDNNTAIPAGTLGNITVADYYVGFGESIAMNIYNSVAISRPITTTEIATVSVSALT